MADKRISQLIERTDIANNDVLPIVASAAITTNKVTVSTIQDWMQDNLDLGVTSVGITVGSSGTDINVTGSPITTSGNITINIPTASATNRGLLSSADWTTFNNKQDAGNFVTIDTLQTVTGQKTFNSLRINSSNGIIFTQQGGHGIPEIGNTMTTAIANDYRFIFGLGSANYKSFSFVSTSLSNNVNRALVVPDASGTIALTTNLTDFVTLSTAQTITATKTFNNSGGASNIIVNHTSGSGIALDITKGGNGEGIRVNKTGGSGNAVTITGGLLSAEAATLTGALSGTSASFTGNAIIGGSLKWGQPTGGQVQFMYRGDDGIFANQSTTSNSLYSGSNFFSIRNSSDTSALLTVLNTGNVGIGTASPTSKLNILNTNGNQRLGFDQTNDNNINIRSVSGKNSSITFTEEGIADRWTFGVLSGNGDLQFRSDSSHLGNGSERMRITSAGNVGIGAASPDDKLEIGGAGAGIILASPDGTRYRVTVTDLGVLTVAAV
jgi:hypothetical protein